MHQESTSNIRLVLKTNRLLHTFMSDNNLDVFAQKEGFAFCLKVLNKTKCLDPVVKIKMNLNTLNDDMLICDFLNPNFTHINLNKGWRAFEKQVRPASAIVAISVLALYLSMTIEVPASPKEKKDWKGLGALRFIHNFHPTTVTAFREKGNWQCPEDFKLLANFCYFWLCKYKFLQNVELKFDPVYEYGQKIYNGLDVSGCGIKNNNSITNLFILHSSWCSDN